MLFSKVYDTNIGKMRITHNEEGICSIGFLEEEESFSNLPEQESTLLLEDAYKQLVEYLDGKRKIFDLPFSLKGTDFQMQVWDQMLKIPYGCTWTYGQIAHNINNPKAVRAVGGACNRNPIMIMVPCHRVMGKDGSLTGYASGVHVKKHLLELEAENK